MLIKDCGAKFTPELKRYTQGGLTITYDEVRDKIAQEYLDANVDPSLVWLASFNYPDIEYWLANFPNFGKQAVALDGPYYYCIGTFGMCNTDDDFTSMRAAGVEYLAPPMQMLLQVKNKAYVPSEYAVAAKQSGFKIITWTLERSGPIAGGGGWYYGTANDFTNNDFTYQKKKEIH